MSLSFSPFRRLISSYLSVVLLLSHYPMENFSPSTPAMNRTVEPGLEVRIPTNPEVAAQPYEDKYGVGDRGSNNPVLDQPSHAVPDRSHQSPNQLHAKIQNRPKVILVLVVIVVSCLIAAVGAGLGAGLAAQRKSSPAR